MGYTVPNIVSQVFTSNITWLPHPGITPGASV